MHWGSCPDDLRLRAPEEKRKKFQSFGQAAEESFGSSAGTRRSTTSRNSADSRNSHEPKEKGTEEEEEVLSPIKPKGKGERSEEHADGRVPKNLFKEKVGDNKGQKKRKPSTGNR